MQKLFKTLFKIKVGFQTFSLAFIISDIFSFIK